MVEFGVVIVDEVLVLCVDGIIVLVLVWLYLFGIDFGFVLLVDV